MLPRSATISQQHSSVAYDEERGLIEQVLVDQKDGENLPLRTVVLGRIRSPSLYSDYTRIWTQCAPLPSSEVVTAFVVENDNLQEDMLCSVNSMHNNKSTLPISSMYRSPRRRLFRYFLSIAPQIVCVVFPLAP